jgi:saccharopine dehydrogenase-like NADP-dependent oxidoreductase
MKFDFVVLGATGLQGKIVTKDLLRNGYSVLMCGRDKSRILHLLGRYKRTAFTYVDMRDVDHAAGVIRQSGANIVVNCVECLWNLNALDACIAAGAHSIDLGSDIPMTRRQLAKDRLLKKKGLIHITGSGSVPGIGNVMLRYIAERFDSINGVDVGFAWDSNIKTFVVPFSIRSIIEEFTTPAPFVTHRKVKQVMPLSSVVIRQHRAIEKERQFNVGHHPEVHTMFKYLQDKGIQSVRFFAGFPDHSFETIVQFINLGFASEKPIRVNGAMVKPIDFLVESLKHIRMPKGYEETENLWVEVRGNRKKTLMECIVPPLKGWEDAGCNIDTGMPASIMAQMIKTGVIDRPGAYAPEQIIPPMPFFQELRKRGMIVLENGKRVN